MAHVGQLGEGDVPLFVNVVDSKFFPHVEISTDTGVVMSLRLDEAKSLMSSVSLAVYHLEHPPLFDASGL